MIIPTKFEIKVITTSYISMSAMFKLRTSTCVRTWPWPYSMCFEVQCDFTL